jgi:hypothetical protein
MFRLRRGGVYCERDGLFVGPVALLTARKDATGAATWTVRRERELNDELSACYGLPIENILGYQQHHIVGQNPSNVAKREVEKFGRAMIDDPSNLVWVPTLLHEQISNYYSEEDPDDPQGRTRRDVIGKMDFDQQRAIGLQQLREQGVLK